MQKGGQDNSGVQRGKEEGELLNQTIHKDLLQGMLRNSPVAGTCLKDGIWWQIWYKSYILIKVFVTLPGSFMNNPDIYKIHTY